MRFGGTTITLLTLLSTALAAAPAAYGHATYNLQGYGENLAGSTNGVDGSQALPDGEWSNGPAEEYTGSLPLNWYAGMHSATQVRTIQTGIAANAPSGSLAAQIITYNTTNDPDLTLMTPVLAVGGLSWLDPMNVEDGQAQGWGHGLDYGIIHYTPLDTIFMDGPVKFTLTLSDDPSDTAVTKLAFVLYGGWDTGATSERHQTFVTQPMPVDNPLGSTGLTLLDYVAATSPGATLSRTYTLDDTYDGKYTVLVAGQDGVPGQYQLTISTAPDTALGECRADADGDASGDTIDACADTPAGTEVDQAGCSQLQFCAGIDATTKAGAKRCKAADWKNDEPVMTRKTADCAYQKKTKVCAQKS